MGYDISFFTPGREDDRLNDELLLHLTNEQEAAWRRIVARAQQQIGPTDEGRYPTHLELWLHDPAMQLCYAGNSASIEIPYRYTASVASAHAAVATAYALARIVEAETGMRGLDDEVSQAIQEYDLPKAVARYRGVGQNVRDLVAGQDPNSASTD
ncbi:hypothetical protein ACWD69_19145 [Micromonospora chokoriensis]